MKRENYCGGDYKPNKAVIIILHLFILTRPKSRYQLLTCVGVVILLQTTSTLAFLLNIRCKNTALSLYSVISLKDDPVLGLNANSQLLFYYLLFVHLLHKDNHNE